MRTKAERRMLHMSEKPSVKKGKGSGMHSKFFTKTKDKFYEVTRLSGQDYYKELKTPKQTRRENNE